MSIIAIVTSLLTMTAFAQTKTRNAPVKAAPVKTAPAKVEPVKKNTGLIGHAVEPTSNGAYGMSGCGLGSVLFGESDNRGGQVLSATTNGIYSNNTFGMSSGTSNCTPDRSSNSAAVKANLEKFVVANREALANDVAKSNGETVIAMSELMGCKDNEYLGTKLQSRYESIFNSKNETTVASNMWDTVSTDRYLIENCKL